LLADVIPQTRSRITDGGYVYVRSTNGVQIYGIELFFLVSGRVYANVPGTRMTGLGLLPPPASATVGTSPTIVVEDTLLGDSAGQPLTSFQACNVISVMLQINNTTGQTARVARQYRAVGPNGYNLMLYSLIGDQAPGRTLRYASVTVPCAAPAGVYTLT